jgi:hypothetical protein
MELTPRDILFLVGLPVLLAAVAMLATRPWRRGRDLGGWGAAVAIAGGLQLAFVNEFGVPRFPPASAQQWIFYFAVPLVLVAGALVFVKSKWFAIVAPLVVLGAIPWVMLRNFSFDTPQLRWTWIAGGAVAIIAWWAAMEPLARRARGGALPLLLGVVMGVTGLAIIDGGIKTLGFVTGSVAFPLFVVAAAATWSRGSSVARGGVLTLAGLLGALLICGHLLGYPGVPILDVALLALAPLAAWAGELPGLGKPDSWKRGVIRVVAVLAVLALPAFHAATGLKKTADETFDSYSY